MYSDFPDSSASASKNISPSEQVPYLTELLEVKSYDSNLKPGLAEGLNEIKKKAICHNMIFLAIRDWI